MNRVVIRKQYGEAILQFSTQFINDELTINITNSAFANFLDGLQAPNLRSVNINLLLELENETGLKTIINLPIPGELLDKTPTQLREMDATSNQ